MLNIKILSCFLLSHILFSRSESKLSKWTVYNDSSIKEHSKKWISIEFSRFSIIKFQIKSHQKIIPEQIDSNRLICNFKQNRVWEVKHFIHIEWISCETIGIVYCLHRIVWNSSKNVAPLRSNTHEICSFCCDLIYKSVNHHSKLPNHKFNTWDEIVSVYSTQPFDFDVLTFYWYLFLYEIDFDSFRNAHAYEHLKNRHRNPNIIVASYVATGNLLGQVSQGKSIVNFLINIK